jgi:putative flippase GtrA
VSLRHFVRFNLASLIGIPIQLAALWTLVHAGSVPYVPATALAVSVAVTHNFWWHWHWTWADRRRDRSGAPDAFGRFAATNGSVSLLGNLLVMPVLVGWLGVPLVPANLAAIALSGFLNFWLADRVVFCAARIGPPPDLWSGPEDPVHTAARRFAVFCPPGVSRVLHSSWRRRTPIGRRRPAESARRAPHIRR